MATSECKLVFDSLLRSGRRAMIDRRTFLLASAVCAGTVGLGVSTGCVSNVFIEGVQEGSHNRATVYSGGAIYPASGAAYAEAAVVRGGSFIYAGSLEKALSAAGPNCKRVDLEGRMMIPSFFEAHAHPNLGSLFDLRELDYADGKRTPEAYVAHVRRYLQDHPGIQALRGLGWDISEFSDGYPRKELLDQASTDIPIFIRDAGQHMAWVNSKALACAGVTRGTSDPVGGRIERDATGEPTGTVLDMATNFIEAALPPVTVEEEKELILKFQEMEHRLGVTGHMCAAVVPNSTHYAAYRGLLAEEKLKMYSQLAFYMLPDSYKDTIEWLSKEIASFEASEPNEVLGLRMAKFFIDGVVSGQTAYLLEDYASRPGYRGESMWPADMNAIQDAFRQCGKEGLRIHIHALGDAAVRFGLDALEAAATPNRNAITHIELADPKDVARFKGLETIATINPYWFCKGDSFGNVELVQLGQERTKHMYPAKTLYEAGVRVAAASDYPVSSIPDPLVGIEMAVTRTLPQAWRGGRSKEACTLNPDEAITLDQALDAFTLSAAYAYGLEGTTGSIEAGKSADFVVLDRNLFTGPPSEAKVLETWFRGELVYQA